MVRRRKWCTRTFGVTQTRGESISGPRVLQIYEREGLSVMVRVVANQALGKHRLLEKKMSDISETSKTEATALNVDIYILVSEVRRTPDIG